MTESFRTANDVAKSVKAIIDAYWKNEINNSTARDKINSIMNIFENRIKIMRGNNYTSVFTNIMEKNEYRSLNHWLNDEYAAMKYKRKTVFLNYLDIVLYLTLAVLYPILSLSIQHKQVDLQNLNSVYNFFITGFLFFLTFFYDFYNKYSSYKSNVEIIGFILFFGRIVFAILSILLVAIIIMVSAGITEPGYFINGFKWFFIFDALPVGLSLIELVRRLIAEFKGNISKATV